MKHSAPSTESISTSTSKLVSDIKDLEEKLTTHLKSLSKPKSSSSTKPTTPTTTISTLPREFWHQFTSLRSTYTQLFIQDFTYATRKLYEQKLQKHFFAITSEYRSTIASLSNSITKLRAEHKKARSTNNNSNNTTSLSNAILEKLNELRTLRAEYRTYLTDATGYYLEFIQVLVSLFNLETVKSKVLKPLDLDGNHNFENIPTQNVTEENKTIAVELCYKFLLQLGDFARYKVSTMDDRVPRNWSIAKRFYHCGIRLCPYIGHAYNQLGVVYESEGDVVSACELYLRAVFIKQPFTIASSNFVNLVVKQSLVEECEGIKFDEDVYEPESNSPTPSDNIVKAFLQNFIYLHKLIFTKSSSSNMQFDRPQFTKLSSKLISLLPILLTTRTIPTHRFSQLLTITFGTWYALTHPSLFGIQGPFSQNTQQPQPRYRVEKSAMEHYHDFLTSILKSTLSAIQTLITQPTTTSIGKSHKYLPLTKHIFNWLHQQRHSWSQRQLSEDWLEVFEGFEMGVWEIVARFLNTIKRDSNNNGNVFGAYTSIPLPLNTENIVLAEDIEMIDYLPYRYTATPDMGYLQSDVGLQDRIRLQQLHTLGLGICENTDTTRWGSLFYDSCEGFVTRCVKGVSQVTVASSVIQPGQGTPEEVDDVEMEEVIVFKKMVKSKIKPKEKEKVQESLPTTSSTHWPNNANNPTSVSTLMSTQGLFAFQNPYMTSDMFVQPFGSSVMEDDEEFCQVMRFPVQQVDTIGYLDLDEVGGGGRPPGF